MSDAPPTPLLSLEERDFELLAPQRMRSKEWNPERLELKRKLLDWCKEVGALFAAGEPPLELDSHSSLHHPTSFNAFKVDHLRAYLSRGKKSRAALTKLLGRDFKKDIDSAYRHVNLSVTITHKDVEVALSIHPDGWWDSQNLTGKCKRQAGELAQVLNRASGFTLRVHEHRPHPAGKIFRDELERALRHFKVGEHYLRFTRSHPRAAVRAADAAAFSSGILDDLAKLVPPYVWIAWSPTNDHLFEGAAGGAR